MFSLNKKSHRAKENVCVCELNNNKSNNPCWCGGIGGVSSQVKVVSGLLMVLLHVPPLFITFGRG